MRDESDCDPNIIKKVRQSVESGRYRFTRHAMDRMKERFLELRDVTHVLTHGAHEENKTKFDINSQCWNYAIRGKTVDGTDARIVVAFEGNMIIITVIRLTKRKK